METPGGFFYAGAPKRRSLGRGDKLLNDAPIYRETDLSGPDLVQARRAITLILTRQEPWPAFLIDRDWTVLAANDAAQRLIRLMLGESRLSRPMNLMQLVLAPDEFKRHIVNWPAFAPALLARAARDASASDDPALQAAWRELQTLPDIADLQPAPSPEPLCEMRLVSQNRSLGLLPTTIAFATPLDPALGGLRIEAFLPSDDESEALLLALAGAG